MALVHRNGRMESGKKRKYCCVYTCLCPDHRICPSMKKRMLPPPVRCPGVYLRFCFSWILRLFSNFTMRPFEFIHFLFLCMRYAIARRPVIARIIPKPGAFGVVESRMFISGFPTGLLLRPGSHRM